MSGKIFLELVDNNSKIKKDLDKALAKELNKILASKARDVEKDIKTAISGWISKSTEFQALQEEGVLNSLNAQLGLLPGQGSLAVEQIRSAILSSVIVEVSSAKTRKIENINLTISVQPSDFSNVLGLSSAFIITEGSTLEWLNWLINLGTSTVVFGFSYTPSIDGRSGGGKMDLGGSWRVPPQFAGTIDDNFITRTLNNHDAQIKEILERIFR